MNIQTLQPIILAMTQERCPERVMQKIVDGLTNDVGYSLTRLWIRRPGDRCDTCRFASECPQNTDCLHLVASNGHSLEPGVSWDSVDGNFSRFPLGVRKIGHIGETGESLHIEDITQHSQWVANPEWVEREQIKSFAGHPLIFRDEILGVLGIFCRAGINETDFEWLKLFADQAAIAFANARAFREIENLKSELEQENALLREEVLSLEGDSEIVGHSKPILQLLQQLELVSPTDAAILINGESGTGKELVARSIHRRSKRADKPLVKVNCAAIPRDLFESEFFGHVKGSFTGAVRDRVGRFQIADQGTLFLDEVGEIPLDLQSKLLRVLQEGEFERIGEATTRNVNVRIIAATNRDLREEVSAGRFREDLYYRLSVFPVQVPPLRNRADDIPLLLAHFLERVTNQLSLPEPKVTRSDVKFLQNYSWPGNVRELGHVIERAVILAKGGKADFSFVRMDETSNRSKSELSQLVGDNEAKPLDSARSEKALREDLIANIKRALEQSNGKIYGAGGAAEILGIPPSTLTSRIRRWKLR